MADTIDVKDATGSTVTVATMDSLKALVGEVQASPTSNTLLDRVKALLTGTVLAAGSAVIGKVSVDQTTPGTTNLVESRTNARRAAGVTHRSAVTSADRLATPAQPTGTGVTVTGGSLASATAHTFAVVAGNGYGTTAVSTVSGNVTPGGSNNAVRVTVAQVTGATYYDLFLSASTSSALWVGRITETQRAAGSIQITTVGTVAAGSSSAGTVDIGVVGSGLDRTNALFAASTAYTPATPTAIDCTGYGVARVQVSLALTDVRSTPALVLVPFFKRDGAADWYAGNPLALTVLGAAGASLQQEFEIPVAGASGLVVLVDSISGQGAAATVYVELS